MMLILFYQSLLDRYSWYLNGSQIKDNTEIVAIKNTGELLISKICTYQLLGIFYCIAENKYGSTVSPFVKISEPGNQNNKKVDFNECLRKKQEIDRTVLLNCATTFQIIEKQVANENVSNFYKHSSLII